MSGTNQTGISVSGFQAPAVSAAGTYVYVPSSGGPDALGYEDEDAFDGSWESEISFPPSMCHEDRIALLMERICRCWDDNMFEYSKETVEMLEKALRDNPDGLTQAQNVMFQQRMQHENWQRNVRQELFSNWRAISKAYTDTARAITEEIA